MALQDCPARPRRPWFTALVPGLALAALAGCVSKGDAAPLGQPLVLSPGEQVKLPDSTLLRYLGVTTDSRCPPDVQCVRAGDANIAIGLAAHGEPTRSTTINTRDPEADIGRWHLRLLALGHGTLPQLTLQVDQRQP